VPQLRERQRPGRREERAHPHEGAGLTTALGEAQDELAVTYEGEPLEIGFNAMYLLEILKYMPTDEVRFTFKAPERATTIEPVGWNDPASYMALVMPLRLVD